MAARQLNDSRQLVYTRASTRTNCTTNWNGQMNFRPEGYGWPTIVCLNSVDRRRCGQQARPSTTFVDYTIDAVAILFKSTVWDKVWEWSAEVLSWLEALPRDRSKEARTTIHQKTRSMYSTSLIEFRRVGLQIFSEQWGLQGHTVTVKTNFMYGANVRHHAKFHQNRSNGCGDMAI